MTCGKNNMSVELNQENPREESCQTFFKYILCALPVKEGCPHCKKMSSKDFHLQLKPTN